MPPSNSEPELPGERLFIAVDPAAETRRRAGAIIGELRAAGVTARWVDLAAMHLTLLFLGEGLAEQRPAIAAVVDQAVAGRQPFELAFGGVGLFPATGRPRVIWLGVTRGADELADLHEAMTARLEPLGVPLERRPFRPHLTLGRFGGRGRDRPGPVAAAGERFAGVSGGSGRVESVTLYASRLESAGAVHTALHTALLGRSGSAAE